MVDTTAPVTGLVSDGASFELDVQFTTDTNEISVIWSGFSDPESLIKTYSVDVYRTPEGRIYNSFCKTLGVVKATATCVCVCVCFCNRKFGLLCNV